MRAAVLGSPVAHSLSPVLHNAGYAAAGLTDWTYTAHECVETDLAAFVDELGPEWAGLSLTMPLKEAALGVADGADPLVVDLGAANTMLLRDGRRHLYNTDAPGLTAALAEAGTRSADQVAILGAGGTARAALAAARDLGAADTVVFARRVEAATVELGPVADRLGLPFRMQSWDDAHRAGEADVVVSTVPKGVADDLVPNWRPGTVLFDVLYDPWPTSLAKRAVDAGCVVLDGAVLLLAQAVLQFELFTGVPAPVAEMRVALSRRRAR